MLSFQLQAAIPAWRQPRGLALRGVCEGHAAAQRCAAGRSGDRGRGAVAARKRPFPANSCCAQNTVAASLTKQQRRNR